MTWRKILKSSSQDKQDYESSLQEKQVDQPKPIAKMASKTEPKISGLAKKLKAKPYEFPPWYYENCVKTAFELRNHTPALIINHNQIEKRTNAHNADIWEIDAIVYEQILSVVKEPLETKNRLQGMFKKESLFSTDALYLKFPLNSISSNSDATMGMESGGLGFLTAVVEQFAKDLDADLVSLRLSDMEDLCLSLSGMSGAIADNNLDTFFYKGDKENVPPLRPTAEYSPEPTFPFERIVSSPARKRRSETGPADPRWNSIEQQPIIVHIHDIVDFEKNGYLSVVTGLREYLRVSTDAVGKRSIIVIGTGSTSALEVDDDYYLKSMCLKVKRDPILMVPVRSNMQKRLFDRDQKSEQSIAKLNINVVKRAIKQQCPVDPDLLFLQPYSKWDFLEGTRTLERLGTTKLDKKEIAQIVREVGTHHETSHLQDVILGVRQMNDLVEEWYQETEEHLDSKWSSLSVKAQSAIKEIESSTDQETFRWEKLFLDLIIDPEKVGKGWADIELEPEVKEATSQLIEQHVNGDTVAYGILRNSSIGGALLYGPPGTGKTQLARVLAHESKTIMICASAADIENKYIGETPQAIRGLFNLGRMLAPSIVFIDEADSLFQGRSSEDKPWHRARLNQLLHEMDGISKSRTTPFVVLSTNLPSDLDDAVLRRIPCRLHIGLPSSKGREQIFKICLQGEILDEDVDLDALARKTSRYSGSDIQTLCMQAAMVCDKFVVGGEKEGVRLLNMSHFLKALNRTAPTVSKRVLAEIGAFAKQYDPAAYERSLLQEASEA